MKLSDNTLTAKGFVMNDCLLILDDHRGVYIPRDFALEVRRECVSGVDPTDFDILEAGPDHEWYWEAWDNVCRDAIVTDDNGQRYTVYQDGACWLIPIEWHWSDADEWFVPPQLTLPL